MEQAQLTLTVQGVLGRQNGRAKWEADAKEREQRGPEPGGKRKEGTANRTASVLAPLVTFTGRRFMTDTQDLQPAHTHCMY